MRHQLNRQFISLKRVILKSVERKKVEARRSAEPQNSRHIRRRYRPSVNDFFGGALRLIVVHLSDLGGLVTVLVHHRLVPHQSVAIVQMDGWFDRFADRYQLKRARAKACLENRSRNTRRALAVDGTTERGRADSMLSITVSLTYVII